MHRHSLFLLVTWLALAIAGVGALPAQSEPKLPRRPRLPEGQDTNSALTYYQLGVDVLARDVDRAADAFFWASRIDPGWAAPVYGRYAALLLVRNSFDVGLFLTDRRKAIQRDPLRKLDSMAYDAQLKNPFVDRRLDATVLSTWISRETGGEFELRDLGRYDRRFTAWAAYARNDFQMANSVYREEIKRRPKDIDLRFMSGRSFFAQAQFDSARAAVEVALGLIRDSESDVYGWVPHAFGEYSLGFLFGVTKQWDSAIAAYERALLDDIGFHPAHRELARTRLILGDTAGAVAEFTEALNLAPNEAPYLYELGLLLMSTSKVDSASRLLQRAIAQEPWYAPPYLPLAYLYERAGFTKEASDHYTQFIQRAAGYMGPQINTAKQRLARLQATPQ